MQRYSQEIPWVLVDGDRRRFTVECSACGARGLTDGPGVHVFARGHAEHTAQGGIGLGDLVHHVASPIARAMGKPPCTPCEARRNALNQFRWPR